MCYGRYRKINGGVIFRTIKTINGRYITAFMI